MGVLDVYLQFERDSADILEMASIRQCETNMELARL